MKLSIVIPARNESGNIRATLDNLRCVLVREEIPYEIIVVDDGSTDGTASEVLECSRLDPNVVPVANPGRNGFGRAVRCGLNRFTGDAVIICMADASDSPEDVVKYYQILRDEAECAFGSRWIKGGSVSDYPPLKRIINRFSNIFIRLLFGLRYNDITNAFKGYRRYVIDGCRPLISPQFNLTVEIPLKAIVRGYSYAVIPITWKNRKLGQSNLKIQEMGSRYLFILLSVWLEKLLTRDDYHREQEEIFLQRSAGKAEKPDAFACNSRSASKMLTGDRP
ncbi:MAG: glycosyltransferase family 2 protein [Syntrophobacteraceae bacterium]